MKLRPFLSAAGIAGTTLVASCSDPILDDTIDAQGNETQNIPKGEFHRAGQRCVVCHQEGGEASGSIFTVAGTVFAQPAKQIGVDNVEVRFTDSDGSKHTATSNCVGNFFVKPSDWQPKFPILVEIFKNNVRRRMTSPIGRESDCAGCHFLEIPPKDPFSQIPHIYLFGSDEPGTPEGDPSCTVDPKRPGSP